jgi:hypothetical protein
LGLRISNAVSMRKAMVVGDATVADNFAATAASGRLCFDSDFGGEAGLTMSIASGTGFGPTAAAITGADADDAGAGNAGADAAGATTATLAGTIGAVAMAIGTAGARICHHHPAPARATSPNTSAAAPQRNPRSPFSWAVNICVVGTVAVP